MFRWVSSDFHLLNSFETELLISFHATKLVLAIYHPLAHAIVAFVSFPLSTPAEEKLELRVSSYAAIIIQEPLFQKRYKNVKVCAFHRCHTLIPSDFFDSKLLHHYFEKITDKAEHEILLFDYLKSIDSFNIYATEKIMIAKLNEWFHQVKIYDVNTVMIQNILRETKATRQSKIWVLKEKNHLYLYFIENGKLIFNNIFEVFNDEEIIYYILAVCQQIHQNINHIHVVFSGDFEEENIKNQYAQFFEQYSMDKTPKGITLPEIIIQKFEHCYHPLFALAICE